MPNRECKIFEINAMAHVNGQSKVTSFLAFDQRWLGLLMDMFHQTDIFQGDINTSLSLLYTHTHTSIPKKEMGQESMKGKWNMASCFSTENCLPRTLTRS